MTDTAQGRLRHVQYLRAVAVLSVIAYHAEWGLPGGFIGVDLFFVISGYLITGLLLREIRETGTVDLPSFWGRRVRRLLPASTVVLAAVLLLAVVVLPPIDLAATSWAVGAAALSLVNWLFIEQATDYLSVAEGAQPTLHYWSLSVEEQFYVAVPIAILVAARAGRSPGRARARVASVLAVVVAGSLLHSLHMAEVNGPFAFFSPTSRAWQFGAGGLLSLRALAGPRSSRILSSVGLVGLVALMVVLGGDRPYPGVDAIVVTAVSAMLVSGGRSLLLADGSRVDRGLLWVGDRSYSLYLWHWPLLVWAGPGRTPAALVAVLATFALASLTYRFVEEPLRSAPSLVPPRRAAALAVALSGTIVGLAVVGASDVVSGPRVDAAVAAARDEIPRIYDEGCHLDVDGVEPTWCEFGTVREPSVLLLGDSHAAQWEPALRDAADAGLLRFTVATKAGCGLVDVEPWNPLQERPYPECEAWRAEVLRGIAAERFTAVVVANAAARPFLHSGRLVHSSDEPSAWQDGIRSALTSLVGRGVPVTYLADSPHPGTDVPRCLTSRAASCEFARAAALGPALADARAAAQVDGVRVVDLSDRLCPQDPCPVTIDGLVAYRDDSHLSVQVVRHLADVLLARIGLASPWPPVDRGP